MSEPRLIGVREHPRAARAVRRARGYGGLLGLIVTALGSHLHGAPLFDVGVNGLAGGFAAYMLTWAASVAAWRHLLQAEARAVVERLREREAA